MRLLITNLTRFSEGGEIAYVWGVGPKLESDWKMTGRGLLIKVAAGSKEYFTIFEGIRTLVVAKKDRYGELYLTTIPNAFEENNLFDVPSTITDRQA